MKGKRWEHTGVEVVRGRAASEGVTLLNKIERVHMHIQCVQRHRRTHLEGDLTGNVDIEQVQLSVSRDELARGVVHRRGIVQFAICLSLGD